MEIAFRTDKGIMRNNNEDAFLVREDKHVFAVADGVGGNNSGEIASRTCVEFVSEFLDDNDLDGSLSDENVIQYFNRCIEGANHKVLMESVRDDDNRGMATTIVCTYKKQKKLLVFNVGDSRAYIFHDGYLEQITEDHTYVNSLVKAGLITEDEAVHHENRNMITRAVGVDQFVDVDSFEVSVEAGDIILLCTDGLYDEIEDDDIKEALEKVSDMEKLSDVLVKEANNNGGSDNITLILLKITEDDIR